MSCKRCIELAHTGEGRVTVALTVSELIELGCAVLPGPLRERLFTAAALLDPERVQWAREDLAR